MWKIRELKRLKRDMEKQREREEEAAELAQRRLMTDAEAMREKEEREAQMPERGQQKFLQKYYHKGAFYQVRHLFEHAFTRCSSTRIGLLLGTITTGLLGPYRFGGPCLRYARAAQSHAGQELW